MKEFIEEGAEFFEDIFEHFFEHDESKKKHGNALLTRTKHAYHFTEKVDSIIKMVFGASILVSALAATAWGFASVGDLVKSFVESWPGRIVLLVIGVSYLVNGLWRLFHNKS